MCCTFNVLYALILHIRRDPEFQVDRDRTLVNTKLIHSSLCLTRIWKLLVYGHRSARKGPLPDYPQVYALVWRIRRPHCDFFLIVHGEKLTDIPDEYLAEIGPIAKKLAQAIGTPDYNILQVH